MGVTDPATMDCSVVPVKAIPGATMISTTDFFYPLVDDPYAQGQIGAANVLSDMYSMGINHIDTVLMILAASRDMEPDARHKITLEMMRGFNDTCKAAGTSVTGGQTVLNPWPIIGGVATSVALEGGFIRPEGGKAGDVLVLTKPLGTQVAVNLHQWYVQGRTDKWDKLKGFLTRDDVAKSYADAMNSMRRLNRAGAAAMITHGAHGATDVTGFGILGHAGNLANNQDDPLHLVLKRLPVLKHMLAINDIYPFGLRKGTSAETSGGLLVMLPGMDAAQAYLDDVAKADGLQGWIVGEVVAVPEGDPKARTASLADDLEWIEV